MAILFAMPVAFSAPCSCADTCSCLADGDGVCTGDECEHTSCASKFAGCQVIMLSPLQTPLCGCENDCPCECRRGDEVSTLAELNWQNDRKKFVSIDSCVETVTQGTPSSSCVAVSKLLIFVATSALQRCISLSRFTL